MCQEYPYLIGELPSYPIKIEILRAHFFIEIKRIFVCRVSEFLNIVKFMNTPLHLSIQKFYKKEKGLEF